MSPATLTVEGPIGIITLNAPPVNVLNEALWSSLLECLDEAERLQRESSSVRSLIFVSALSKVFTAGNDITTLYVPSSHHERYTSFWKKQTLFLARLYRSPLLTIAAIKGACPAGGTIIALCCDYRILASDVPATMGLNEVALGVPVPLYWMRILALTVGQRRAEMLVMSGTLVDGEEAHRLNLVDRLVPQAALLNEAIKWATERLKYPDPGRQKTKDLLRAELSKAWEAQWQAEAKYGWEALNEEPVVRSLKGVLQRLSKSNDPTTFNVTKSKL